MKMSEVEIWPQKGKKRKRWRCDRGTKEKEEEEEDFMVHKKYEERMARDERDLWKETRCKQR